VASNGFAIVGLGHYAETSRVDSRVGVEGCSDGCCGRASQGGC